MNANLDYNVTLAQEIARCRPWIEAALHRSNSDGVATHDFDDVAGMIMDDLAQLWSTDKGCVVTYVTHYPQSSVLTVWLAGGDFDQVMNRWESAIYRNAESHGCHLMYVLGRVGWKRRLRSRGFKEHAAVLTKTL